jgi:hypothetical protein
LQLDGVKVSSGNGTFQAFGARVVAEDRSKVVPDATYTLEPTNTSPTYRWTVNPGLQVRLRK